jgi:hypothetical protein
MSPNEKTKRLLESSEDRRNRRVDLLLKDPGVRAAIQRDQHPEPDEDNQESSSRRLAAN